MWHVHGVDLNLVEERCGVIDSGWKLDFGGLVDLALVTSLNIPLHVSVKCRPPEAVKKDVVHGIKTLMAKLVVGITNECILNGGAGVELMLAMVLLPPKASSSNEETVGSANKTGQCIGG
jgi:hypothetical protein